MEEGGRRNTFYPNIAPNGEGLLGVRAISELGDREVWAWIHLMLWVEAFH